MAFEYSPRHLKGFGSTGKELLDRIASLNLRMFDLGMGGHRVQPLRPVTPQQLQRRFSPNGPFFTNLLLVKGRRDLLAEMDPERGDR